MKKAGIRCSLGRTDQICQDNFLTEKQQSIGHLRLQTECRFAFDGAGDYGSRK